MTKGSWRNRVLAGLKGGGQFTAMRRPEADTSLALNSATQRVAGEPPALTSPEELKAQIEAAERYRKRQHAARMDRYAEDLEEFKTQLREACPEAEAFNASCDPSSARVQMRLRDGTVQDLNPDTGLRFHGHQNWVYLKEVSDSGEDWMSVAPAGS
ncbi:hypothetical protein LG293_17760 (plasmid) [Citricoccus nitrophenolicus]